MSALDDIYLSRGRLKDAINTTEYVAAGLGPSKLRNLLDRAQGEMEAASEILWKAAKYQERLMRKRKGSVSTEPKRAVWIEAELVSSWTNPDLYPREREAE